MKLLLNIVILSFLLINISFSQIPKKLNYQGVLTDNSGNPLSGAQTLTLKLYDVANGGSELWAETQSVDVVNGVFNVILGEVTPLNLAFDEQYWLGITVDPNPTELSPRIQLTSAAYSLNSLTAADTSFSYWQKTGDVLHYDGGRVFLGRTNSISGNEYFGITTPTGADVYGGMYINTSDINGWPFYGYATGGSFRAWHYLVPSDSTWRLNYGGDKMTVKQDGRFGFRTLNPVSSFVIVHDQFLNGSTPGNYGGLTLVQSSNLNNWEFYVSQSTNHLRLYYNDGALGLFNSATGNYEPSSDMRLKKNVKPMSGMLNVIKQLEPVTYQLIQDYSNQEAYGLIAQDVEKVLPDIVSTINGDDGDGIQNLRTVSYTELIPVLIKAVQEQQVIIEELQNQVDELKRRVN